MPTPRDALLLSLALLVLGREARADAATEARLRDALRTTTAQLRALEDEKARWVKTEADLRAELQTLHGLPPPPRSTASERQVASLSRRVNELSDDNGKLRASLSRCEAGAVQRRATGDSADEVRKQLGTEIAALKERLTSSEEKNLEMYQVGKDLLGWLEKIGVGGEPFFGWKRVQLENVAQEYADRLLEKKVKQQ